MKFPSNSSDLNPIENLWRILKMRVSDLKPKNTEQLRKCIQKIWKNLSKDLSERLINTMPDRIKAVIETDGDVTMF